jgi:iron-sulfur cluster assembly protein
MIDITETAHHQLLTFLKNSPGSIGVRVFLTTKGCGGNKYDFEVVNNVPPNCDAIALTDKYWLFVDLKASLFLFGSQLVYKNEQFFEGFDFINPQEKGRCGCGQSVIL